MAIGQGLGKRRSGSALRFRSVLEGEFAERVAGASVSNEHAVFVTYS
jgi:hypothetical protein